MPCRCPHPGGLEQLEGEGVGVCIGLDEGGGTGGGRSLHQAGPDLAIPQCSVDMGTA